MDCYESDSDFPSIICYIMLMYMNQHIYDSQVCINMLTSLAYPLFKMRYIYLVFA